MDKRAGNQKPALHPARERPARLVSLIRNAELFQQLLRVGNCGFAGDSIVTALIYNNVNAFFKRIEIDFLRHYAYMRARHFRIFSRIVPEYLDRAGGFIYQASNNSDYCRFTGAVWSQKREKIPNRHT